MRLNHDDILRELELLPVWRLKAPLPAAPVQPVALTTVAEAPISAPEQALPAENPSIEDDLPALDISLSQGRRDSIMQLSWEDLSTSVSHCQACGISKSRQQTVFGTGSLPADWFIVAAAPSAEEDAQGLPFVQAAGELLNNMLAAIKLNREQNVYLSHVLKCSTGAERALQHDEVQHCLPYFKRQLALLQPKVILLLGETAAQSLLQSTLSLDQMRAQEWQFEGVPVIVSYHPQHLLQHPRDKALAWQDLCRAHALMQTL
jgi:uracil-DNA glycosylase